jgi:hypothetical protein
MTSPDPDPNAWTSPFEDLLEQGTASGAHDLGASEARQPNPTFGTPGTDSAYWEGQQQLPDDCAIKCQQYILEQFTGHAVGEGTLVREAVENGWYAPGQGTTPENVGNLLELHGVGVTHYQHASQFHLAMELAQGHKVIVGVESDALWHHNPLLEGLRDALGIHGVADHAVVVSGIDTSDPQHVLVQVSDPGTGQALANYPLEQFLEAWRGSDFFMVATHDPAPAHLPEMANFDYAAGHIADVAGLPYDQFLEFADHPGACADAVHQFVEAHHDADGQYPLHDPAIPEHHGEHIGHQDAAGHYHDPVTDHHHHDGGLGHLDTTDHLTGDPMTDPHHHDGSLDHLGMTDPPPDDHWHHDMG